MLEILRLMERMGLDMTTTVKSTQTSGFTLIELVITVAIVGILATLAMPSFREFILNQRVKNASFDLMAALTLTRSEAIKRNDEVALTKETGGWQDGWSVHGGLRKWGPYSGLTITPSPDVGSVTYRKDGRVTSGAAFTIDDADGLDGVQQRCIRIDLSGRPNSSIGGCS